MTYDVGILGCGEIGQPIQRLCKGAYGKVLGIDLKYDNQDSDGEVAILHVAIPGNTEGFNETVLKQIKKRKPVLVIINSTVYPRTTGKILDGCDCDVAHVQVHGKHLGNSMRRDILNYPCFIATESEDTFKMVSHHYAKLGVPYKNCVHIKSSLTGELMKLVATSLFGLLIAWENTVNDIASEYDVPYKELNKYKELNTKDFDVKERKPGKIGGHCVVPNIKVLKECYPSKLWDYIIEKS